MEEEDVTDEFMHMRNKVKDEFFQLDSLFQQGKCQFYFHLYLFLEQVILKFDWKLFLGQIMMQFHFYVLLPEEMREFRQYYFQ